MRFATLSRRRADGGSGALKIGKGHVAALSLCENSAKMNRTFLSKHTTGK